MPAYSHSPAAARSAGFVCAGLLLKAALDRATMEPRELAQDRSHWDAAIRRLFEGALQSAGRAPG
jgi:hypothetical protein